MSNCDRQLLDKLAALPNDSDEIHAVLKLFRCKSIVAAVVLHDAASRSERVRYARELRNIFAAGTSRSIRQR